jgi:hypothetical protein
MNVDDFTANECLPKIDEAKPGETIRISIKGVQSFDEEGKQAAIREANQVRNRLLCAGRGYTVNVYYRDLPLTSDCGRFTDIGLSIYKHLERVAQHA